MEPIEIESPNNINKPKNSGLLSFVLLINYIVWIIFFPDVKGSTSTLIAYDNYNKTGLITYWVLQAVSLGLAIYFLKRKYNQSDRITSCFSVFLPIVFLPVLLILLFMIYIAGVMQSDQPELIFGFTVKLIFAFLLLWKLIGIRDKDRVNKTTSVNN